MVVLLLVNEALQTSLRVTQDFSYYLDLIKQNIASTPVKCCYRLIVGSALFSTFLMQFKVKYIQGNVWLLSRSLVVGELVIDLTGHVVRQLASLSVTYLAS